MSIGGGPGADLLASGATPRTLRGRGTRGVVVVVAGIVLVAVLVGLSLAVGSRPVSLGDVLRGLAGAQDTAGAIVVRELRLPRTLIAVTVGAALAVAGAVMQALTRNPLAEPGVLGVNAGASLAVVVAISAFGVTTAAGYVWFALAGAALAAAVVLVLGLRNAGPGEHTRLVLAGVALSASLAACTGIVTMRDSDTFSSYRFWVVGSLQGRDLDVLTAVLPLVVVGLALAVLLAGSFDALALGDETGTALGVRVRTVRLLGLLAVTLLAGAGTAAAGPLSFLGLVVPHVVRLWTGPDQRRIVLSCLVGGPALLLAADVVGRVLLRPSEIEAGVVTAFVGAPVLLVLVLRLARGRE